MSRKTAGRLLAAALCTLMAAASCLAVFAAGNTVTIKECDDLQLTLPDNMTAVTRSSEATDPYFVMDNDNTYTVQLSYLDTGAQDFNELTTEQVDSVSRNFLGGTDAELQYSACTPDQIPDGLTWLYLKMSITDPDTGVSNQYQATTVFSGKNITLTLFRNEGDVEGSDYDVLQSIARSVKANRAFSFRKILPFLLIAGGILLAVVLAVVIVKLVKRFKNPDPEKNKKDNDKVIEELAGKYQMRTKPVAIEPSPEQAEQKLDKKPEPQEAPVEIDDAQRRIIRKDFSAEGEAYESKHTAEEAEEPVIEKRELVKPEQKKTEAPAPQTEDYVDIYAESPECRRAREEAEAAEAAAAAAEAQAQAQAQAQVQTQQAPAPEAAPEPVAEEKPEPAPAPEEKKVDYRRYLDDDDDFDDDTATPVRRYSDEDIERLLADTEDSENFN